MIGDFERRVLEALVSGYAAREGMKDRFRSLNEYEIARRLGITSYSYVEYDNSPERSDVLAALSCLQGMGKVMVARSAGRYDAYVPTDQGTSTVVALPEVQTGEPNGAAASPESVTIDDTSPAYLNLDAKLDEIIRLLRSIEQHLSPKRKPRT